MTHILASHAGLLLLLTTIAVIATLAVLIWTVAHHEARTQWLEHEVARLHIHSADVSGDLRGVPDPATPEVSRRYAQMTELERTGTA